MLSILSTTTDSASNITASFPTTAYQLTANSLVRASLRISGLTGTSATISATLRHTTSGGTKIRDIQAFSALKLTVTDTVFGVEQVIAAKTNEKLQWVILSTNVLDTSTTIVSDYIDELAVNSIGINGDATAATNLANALNGTGGVTISANISGSVNSVVGSVGSVTGAVGSVTGAVGSVTGAVGSVTGNVGGNVAGTVASVVGAVGSVTGNVGGNVTGSVGSVVGAVGSVTGNVGGNVVGSVASVSGAVGSVTGNLGGNVVGSVGSVTAATSITSAVKKNQSLSNFMFLMTDSTAHSPATGRTVSVTRSIDGGSFSAGALGSVSEVGNGIYKVSFAASDLNGNVIVLIATATGCDNTIERIITYP